MLTSHRDQRWRARTDHVITSFEGEPAACTKTGIICIRKEMASIEVLGSIPLAGAFLDEPKKHKKKKGKKLKREKFDELKSKPGQPSVKDRTDICDSNLFAPWPEIKKKKRKKKPAVRLNEEFPVTQNKNPKRPKRHKKNRKSKCDLDTHTVERAVPSRPGEHIGLQPILSLTQKEKKPKKRVAFNLSPALLEPKPPQDPSVVRDIFQTQRSGTEEKSTVEENGMESQSTSDDINSQDLFITQKSFSDSYIDLCCSTSAEEVVESQRYIETRPEPHGYTAPCPEPQNYPASSARKRSSPEPQSFTAPSPEPQTYTASSARKWSSLEPPSYTASSASKRSPPEPQSFRVQCPEPQPCSASSARKRSSPEHQSYTAPSPGHRSYTASCPEPASSGRKRSSTKPQSDTSYQSLPKKPSGPAYHPSPPRKPSQHHKLDAFTQTENVFTSPPFATSLRFLYRSTCTDAPVDLSLPMRSRLHPLDVVSKSSEDHRRPEPNTTDQTQSDDSDSHSKSKADLSQLKVVQMRLNESFFFRLKGEGDSPKPRSPLMKLAGSVEKKKP